MHTLELRVPYSETDRMGVVYYANYLVYFERGRTEFLRSLGARYRDWEDKRKMYLPVMKADVNFHSPARYDDLLAVQTTVEELGAAHIVFGYSISNAESGKLVGTGTTKHPLVNERWRPVRIPDDIRELMAPHLTGVKK